MMINWILTPAKCLLLFGKIYRWALVRERAHTHKWKKSAILTATTNHQGTNTYISGARRVAIYFWHNSFSEQVNRRFVSNILTATTKYQHIHAYLEIVTSQSWAGDLKPKRSYRNATPGLLQGSQLLGKQVGNRYPASPPAGRILCHFS